MIPTDPVFYLIGLTTIFIVSVGKGAFGGGLAILGVPLLSLVVSPLDAAIIVAPLVTFMDFFAFGCFGRNTWSKPDLVWLAPALLVGIALGYVFFVSVDPRVVAAGIGAITLIFAIDWFLRGRNAEHKERPVSPPLALLAGSAAGFTTFVAHAGGPPMSAYLLLSRLEQDDLCGHRSRALQSRQSCEARAVFDPGFREARNAGAGCGARACRAARRTGSENTSTTGSTRAGCFSGATSF